MVVWQLYAFQSAGTKHAPLRQQKDPNLSEAGITFAVKCGLFGSQQR
jgi:hypothetical protein